MSPSGFLVPVLVALAVAPAEANVRHAPPTTAEAGKPLELVVDAPPDVAKLVLHVRGRGPAPQVATLDFVRREDGRWLATVAVELVAQPGIEYYITAGDEVVFASEKWPHAVLVQALDERLERDEARTGGRKSRLSALGEWVEFGRTTHGTERVDDHFYRFDGEFAYRLWAYPLEEIHVGYTRLIGTTPQTSDMCPSTDPCGTEAGFKVAGWFELGLAPVSGVHVDARVAVMATAAGAALGGRGELRLGERDASHVALGGEYLADVGANAFFRLGWASVPMFPMAATVEITNLPAADREPGVRLYYDVSRQITDGLRVGIRVGYAARNQSVSGFTGGAGAAVEF